MYKLREFEIMRKKLAMDIEQLLTQTPSSQTPSSQTPTVPDLKLAALLSIGHKMNK